MTFSPQLSSYAEYIENTLNAEYAHISSLRDTDATKMDVYKNKDSGTYIVRIFSANRNDDVFRRLQGKQHKNLPQILDSCSCENCVCVLESYIEGKPLIDVINEQSISDKQAVKYLSEICSALSFLHGNHIVHRDIKPENIIITPENSVVLIDLQSACFTDSLKKKDTVNLGTIGYAAPEQFGISPSSPTTDIYALGVLLNEMVLNTHPTIKTPKGALGSIVKKCTNTQIANRYQTVKELEKALKHYCIFHR